MTLILLTRYPLPGRVKTRMVPVLGEAGAQALHRAMVEDTLRRMRSFSGELEICYEGDEHKMKEWLGWAYRYCPQGEGDLGTRMERALTRALRRPGERAVLIGTDCPGLELHHIEQAFTLLEKCDLVLGPACDGGYYLIGLNEMFPTLFYGIPWGTASVTEKTLELARQRSLRTELLERMIDIDRPEDLADWEAFKKSRFPASLTMIP